MGKIRYYIFKFINWIAPQNIEYEVVLHKGKNRTILIGLVTGLIYSAILLKLFMVAGFPEDTFVKKKTNKAPIQTLSRSDIYDRNKVLVAGMLDTKGLYVNPQKVKNPVKLTKELASILTDMGYDTIYKKVTGKARFVWLKRRLTPKQQYAINALGDIALDFINAQTRVYPHGALLSHTLGYVNVDNQGIGGIEQGKNKVLASGKEDLQLTLDIRLQHILRSKIKKAVDITKAIGATGIIMNVNNGEVLAMTSLPDFDSNHAGKYANRFNRATLGVYELGSTFKIINSAFALDSKKITMRDVFDARTPIRIGRFSIRDYHGKNRPLSVPEIFIYSSNIGSAKMAWKLGKEKQQAFMKKMGLLDKLDIVIPERGRTLYPKKSRWNKTETITISFGHGIAVTPLHLVASVAALVNGGTYYTPKFIKSGLSVGRRVVDKKTSLNIRKLLYLNSIKGSGNSASVDGYMVGGKTGTADKVDSSGYNKKSGTGYDESALISSYIAIFPINDPKYLVYVLVDEPKPSKLGYGARPTGGIVAAPVVGNIIQRIAPLLNVAPVDMTDPALKEFMTMPKPKQKITESIL